MPPELMQPPQEAHRALPVQPQAKEPQGKHKKVHIGLEKLSIRDYEPDFDKVFQAMFGREAKYHEHTGQLVHNTSAAANAAALGPR